MKTKWIYYFWGGMDAFYILRFCYLNILDNRIPLYDDVVGFIDIYPNHGLYSAVMFILSLVLNVSIIFSMFFIFAQRNLALYLVYIQTPLRLFFLVPSLSFIPWLIKLVSISPIALTMILVVFSELMKVLTIIWCKRNDIEK